MKQYNVSRSGGQQGINCTDSCTKTSILVTIKSSEQELLTSSYERLYVVNTFFPKASPWSIVHRDRSIDQYRRYFLQVSLTPLHNLTVKRKTVSRRKSVDKKVKVRYLALLTRWRMLRSAFTISKMAADWHELMIPQRIMRTSVARAIANYWTRDAVCRHTTLGLHPEARKLILISRPAEGRRLSWPEQTIG